MFTDIKSTEHFLARHWQQTPCLLKQALPGFEDPLTPEELAGLACESFVESRLVLHNHEQYTLESGPFRESRFTALPEHDWTLLVQRVDHYLPAVKRLLQQVTFIPAWRIDDIMVSYATKGGGVGPHFDYYDVFIIQGMGSRRWRTGGKCSARDQVLTESGLKLLSGFKAENDWILEAGDVLYIPPGYAHAGEAIDNSLNYSIGFRAPSMSEILMGYSDEVCDTLDESRRYRDPFPQIPRNHGEISAEVLDHLQEMITDLVSRRSSLASWFGKTMTRPAQDNLLNPPDNAVSPQQLRQHIATGLRWRIADSSRFAFIREASALLLFAAGECYVLNPDNALQEKLARELAGHTDGPLPLADFSDDDVCLNCLAELINRGVIEEDNT